MTEINQLKLMIYELLEKVKDLEYKIKQYFEKTGETIDQELIVK